MAKNYYKKAINTLRMYGMKRDPVGPGQESIWDYPRPPKLEKCSKHVKMVFNGVTLVDTNNTYTNKETSHPPCYYFHPSDLKMEYIKMDKNKKTWCEWKGECTYWDVEVNGKRAEGVGFSYENPTPQYTPIKSWLSFYPGPMDGCYVDGEKVTPEPAAYYSGWITKDIVGPFRTV